jgi:hypothetical protein
MTRRVSATRTDRATGTTPARAQLRALSRALRDVHRSLVEFSRERYELENGPVRGKGQLLDLLLNDEAFGWLRPLSRLVVAIDQLSTRRTAVGEQDAAAIRTQVEEFISPTENANAFGSRYCALLPSEPRIAMNHGALREVLRDLPEPHRVDARISDAS